MNLYEWEGKNIFAGSGIAVPKSKLLRRGDDFGAAYAELGVSEVVLKVQILSGKRGKNNGIIFCSTKSEVETAAEQLFSRQVRGQYVASILMETKLNIAEEHYLSITYDTTTKQPVLIYSTSGGMDIEDVPEAKIIKNNLDVRQEQIDLDIPMAQELWNCFLQNDARLVEINPLVKTAEGLWFAADAKVALDEDAFYRHKDWQFEPRSMLGRLPTEREEQVLKIDAGDNYYRGTAGKYIEFDGDIALILNGGGASIANMDALAKVGLKAANYTEYSGNPPREKVYQLAKIVLSKPGLKGLWMCGVVANFTNMKETFLGIIDALDEIKPTYPIVVRRDGPESAEAFALLKLCIDRNNLQMQFFNKGTSMSDTAVVLAEMIKK
ncbi:MAG: ATP citrate lyase citrate-binding domain-containing protein [bacterium]|nr:ATP citrate lyase citrate-binding domain-containing protein [bacterium]